jgi:hypothetical protein
VSYVDNMSRVRSFARLHANLLGVGLLCVAMWGCSEPEAIQPGGDLADTKEPFSDADPPEDITWEDSPGLDVREAETATDTHHETADEDTFSDGGTPDGMGEVTADLPNVEDTESEIDEDASLDDISDITDAIGPLDGAAPDTFQDLSEPVDDAGPEPMEPWAVVSSDNPPPDLEVSVLANGSFSAVYPLPEGFWFEGAEGSQYGDALNGSLVSVPGIEGDVKKVEVLGNQVVLALTDAGLYAFNGALAVPSPLNEAVVDPPVLDLVEASEKDALKTWMVTATTLYLWNAGQLSATSIPNVDFTGAHMAYGAHFQGQSACWIATQSDQLFAAREVDGGIELWEVLTNAPIDELGADLAGNLWVRQQGDLFKRSPDAQWDWYTFDEPLLELAAHRASWMAWFRLDGHIWGHVDGEYWLLNTPGIPSDMHGGSKETLSAVEGQSAVQYQVTSLPAAPAPTTTWSSDVQELSEAKCGLCHGVGQFAHEMASVDQWIDEFPAILTMVQTGQMPLAPLSPLTPVEVQTLLDWESGGFQL